MVRSVEARGGTSLRTKFFVAFAIAAFGLVATYMLLQVSASKKTADVIAAWDGDLGSWDDVMERYPVREPNETALALERIAAELGVGLATRGGVHPSGAHPSPREQNAAMRVVPGDEAAAAFDGMKKPVFDWLHGELQRVDGEITPLPAEGVAYFEAHAETLDRFRRELLLGAAPEWEMNLAAHFSAPIPNLLGHITLQRTLAAAALHHERSGRRVLALETVDAAWRLNGSLRDSPILISQLIAAANARYVAATLRRIDEVPSEWIARLAEHDVRGSMLIALKYEGWVWPHVSDDVLRSATVDESSWTERFVSRAAMPFVRLGVAELSESWQSEIARFGPVAKSCGAGEAEFRVEVSWWNVIGKIATPNLSRALDRADRAAVDLELTRKWIALEQERRMNDDRWPETLPFSDVLDACPEERLVYEVNDEGSASVTLAREIDWGRETGLVLPQRIAGMSTM